MDMSRNRHSEERAGMKVVGLLDPGSESGRGR